MGVSHRWLARAAVGFGLVATATTGCQTYPAGFGGMTLPSPQYLKHYPQYFAPDPDFPLQREQDSMQDPESQLRRGPGGAASVPAAPLGGAPGAGAIAPPVPTPPAAVAAPPQR
ncbi:hypothetical protein [Fimbriiglobus ruber]|uniref:Lipoprotein n=1 Tax=Fimbriiglobus ruber TaxID=1908690 RepID=A0A225EAY5_9BACT|nr:hypothetical protein [Fimbriiglobus ruber]OWK47196.1 hypothetical protein FRUB_00895 [Fimbriiglobus ruber]